MRSIGIESLVAMILPRRVHDPERNAETAWRRAEVPAGLMVCLLTGWFARRAQHHMPISARPPVAGTALLGFQNNLALSLG